MFVGRSLIIFAILLCYYQSWVEAVDCEQEPYNPACRGSQARKRLTPLPVMRSLNCEDGDCKLPRMKFLIAILDDTPYNEIHPSNSVHGRKGRMRTDEMKDVYLDDY
ncbi:PREDICTED: uncharacterized protein LOC108782699 [Cyphomyrmex costatus]|uniref:uncharacterized protein LOC108782699 n=1 Tax=Cyphomyrmex costatus TaxID=456900 RepID=UPI00085236C8|nr:PREDICTED: uncharacterized protein LOC108782699 [Cyphomyrmex costatus]XP_018406532.1 PREDICTED: uncharacterized protein LOC108782699 [Cyphomyrmex costatus]